MPAPRTPPTSFFHFWLMASCRPSPWLRSLYSTRMSLGSIVSKKYSACSEEDLLTSRTLKPVFFHIFAGSIISSFALNFSWTPLRSRRGRHVYLLSMCTKVSKRSARPAFPTFSERSSVRISTSFTSVRSTTHCTLENTLRTSTEMPISAKTSGSFLLRALVILSAKPWATRGQLDTREAALLAMVEMTWGLPCSSSFEDMRCGKASSKLTILKFR
mmetsp:Transcript_55698/g.125589  ORF Transcript_55698/g.125589 Transcript_55698/m.125589 type:complete len:216 (+) Transcript_55698:415-1062(+)